MVQRSDREKKSVKERHELMWCVYALFNVLVVSSTWNTAYTAPPQTQTQTQSQKNLEYQARQTTLSLNFPFHPNPFNHCFEYSLYLNSLLSISDFIPFTLRIRITNFLRL